MNKCFFIFHDYRPQEVWWHQEAPPQDLCEVTDLIDVICSEGWECRKCGRRKIKEIERSQAPGPRQKALNWLKEEVIK